MIIHRLTIVYTILLVPLFTNAQSANYAKPGNCDQLKTKNEGNYAYQTGFDWCDMDSPTPYTDCMCEASEYRELQKGASLMDEVNADVERAKNLEREYYDLLTKAWDTEDEQYARQAITKIKEARKYVDDAHKKYKAYHNPDGIYRSTPKEWTYTNMLSRYDDYVADAENTIDNCCRQEENVIKLTGPQVIDIPEDYEPEEADEEDFWVFGDNNTSGIIEIDGRKVNLANYKFHTYIEVTARCFWGTGQKYRLVSAGASSYLAFAPLDASDKTMLNYIFLDLKVRKVIEFNSNTYYDYKDYLDALYASSNSDGHYNYAIKRSSSAENIKEMVKDVIPCNDFDFMSYNGDDYNDNKLINTPTKLADYVYKYSNGAPPYIISQNNHNQNSLRYFLEKFRPGVTIKSQSVIEENKEIQEAIRTGIINADYLDNDFIQKGLSYIEVYDESKRDVTIDRDRQIEVLAYIIQYFIYLENEYQNRK